MSRCHAVFVFLALISLGGCVTPHRGSVQPPGPVSTGQAPRVDLSPPALGAVAGHIICIDPGHSVEIPGTASPTNGLQEYDLNLRVALRLRDVLQGAGATVLLTRGDAHALDPKNNGNDLTLRAELANTRGAEVFVSIHHNADITPGSEKNDLEVYYKLSDDGPSLDLAQHMTASLARRMRAEAPAKRLLPGNYKVLRITSAPAVLLETSYLTHAPHAAFMATDDAIQAEAFAIADGLNAYFSREPLKLSPPDLASSEGDESIRIRFTGATRPLVESVRVVVDGVETMGDAVADDGAILWRPEAHLRNGTRAIVVTVQNEKGAWSRSDGTIGIDRPVAAIQLTQVPARVAKVDGQRAAVYARALDPFGLPVADGTPLRVAGEDKPVATRDGVAAVYRTVADMAPVRFEADGVVVGHAWVDGGEPRVAVQVRDAAAKSAIAGALVESADGGVEVSDDNGWAWVVPGAVRVAQNGYESYTGSARGSRLAVDLAPVAGGVLHKKVVMLDPAYGGRSPGAIGADGTRASDLNLAVVRRLAQRLSAAGAEVVLARAGDLEVPDSERVRLENNVEPDIYIRVSYGDARETARVVDTTGHLADAGAAYVGHYPGSTTGVKLASAIGSALDIDAVVPCYLYVVQQAGAPAVVIQPGDITTGPSYSDGIGPLWAVADSIYRGIIDFYRR